MTSPPQTIDSLTDRELVARYVGLHDEIAFAALVRRHSSLILGICQRVLGHRQDVEDAFQATFLVLARDAHRVRKRESLASWLHGVAYRTSLRAAESRHRRIRLLQDVTMIEDSSLADVELRHQRQLLDEELEALPEKYRAPLILHYLEGQTAKEVARTLKLSTSTVEGRLKRGRKELHLRLVRRGLGLSIAVAALSATPQLVTAAEAPALVGSTIEAGLSYTAGDPAGPLFTHEAAHLAAQETLAMTLTTTTATVTALLLIPIAVGISNHGTDVPSANINTAASASTTLQSQVQTTPVLLAQAEESSDGATPEPHATDGIEFRLSDNEALDSSNNAEGINAIVGLPESTDESEASEWSDFDLDYWKRIAGTRSRLVTERQSESGDVETQHSIDVTPRVLGHGAGRSLVELDQDTAFEFVDMPLKDALSYMGEFHNISIHLDEARLKEAGVRADAPVTATLEKMKLRDALSQILDPLHLRAVVDTGGIVVTTGFESASEDDIVLNDVQSFDVQVYDPTKNRWARLSRGRSFTSDEVISDPDSQILQPLQIGKAIEDELLRSRSPENDSLDTNDPDQAEIHYFIRNGNLYRRVIRPNESTEYVLTVTEDEQHHFWHHKRQSENEQQIELELSQNTEVEFVETPLTEAVNFIGQMHNIPILIKKMKLDDEGVATDTPVNLIIHNVKLESALNLILEPLGLDYLIENEVMRITSREDADEHLETRVYDLPAGYDQQNFQTLIDLTMEATSGHWENMDGVGGIIYSVPGGLVIRNNQRTHREIEALFEQLEAHAAVERAQPESQTYESKAD